MNRKIPTSIFIAFSASILILGLAFAGAIYYISNIQYQAPTQYSQFAGPVTTPPKSLRLDLDRPDDNTLSFDQSLIVSGKTGPNLDVLVTTDSKDYIIKSDPSGNFSTFINLDVGVNQITVAVFDTTGDNRSSSKTVYYSKEKI